ncbi:hypothetical protein CGSSp11BS70_11061 [Streptococcus pneumoniae SP11-BS70]|nr:hypothetical protein CGSSp11BS70_11061 [Streptococcus pneumoniae SP11-BS70]
MATVARFVLTTDWIKQRKWLWTWALTTLVQP